MARTKTKREIILDTLSDAMSNFLYYDRMASSLKIGEIEDAIKNGEVTVDEMVDIFKRHLLESTLTTE